MESSEPILLPKQSECIMSDFVFVYDPNTQVDGAVYTYKAGGTGPIASTHWLGFPRLHDPAPYCHFFDLAGNTMIRYEDGKMGWKKLPWQPLASQITSYAGSYPAWISKGVSSPSPAVNKGRISEAIALCMEDRGIKRTYFLHPSPSAQRTGCMGLMALYAYPLERQEAKNHIVHPAWFKQVRFSLIEQQDLWVQPLVIHRDIQNVSDALQRHVDAMPTDYDQHIRVYARTSPQIFGESVLYIHGRDWFFQECEYHIRGVPVFACDLWGSKGDPIHIEVSWNNASVNAETYVYGNNGWLDRGIKTSFLDLDVFDDANGDGVLEEHERIPANTPHALSAPSNFVINLGQHCLREKMIHALDKIDPKSMPSGGVDDVRIDNIKIGKLEVDVTCFAVSPNRAFNQRSRPHIVQYACNSN